MERNPYLRPWSGAAPDRPASRGEIERPDRIVNVIWQTRPAAPTAYENDLGNALEKVFGAGAASLADVVAGLNNLGLRAADGQPWTEQSFVAEVKRLGA